MITAEDLATPSPNSIQWGPETWQKLESTVEEIPCKKCGYVGESLISAGHDIVNVKQGKPVFNPENLSKFRKYVDLADDYANGKVSARKRLLETMARDMNGAGIQLNSNCPTCSLAAAVEETASPDIKEMLPIIVAGGLLLGLVVWGMSKPSEITG